MSKFQKLFAGLALVIAATVTVATSKKDEETQYDAYSAISNCANATVVNQAIAITTSFGSIVTPEGMTFLDLGIPKSTLDIANETTVSGTITGGLTRVCTYSLSTTNGPVHTYSCSDNSNPTCQVLFTPQQ